MRFLIDENMPVWLAADPRKLGLAAVDIREVSRPGLTDDAIYNLARRSRRHIVSANYKDFGNPLLYPPTRDTGIIIVRMPKSSIRIVASHVQRFLSNVKQSELSRCLIILEPSRLRRKKL